MNTNSALIVPPPGPTMAATSATNDIRGLKGPVEVPRDWEGYLWLLGFLLAGITLLIGSVSCGSCANDFWLNLSPNPSRRTFAHVNVSTPRSGTSAIRGCFVLKFPRHSA